MNYLSFFVHMISPRVFQRRISLLILLLMAALLLAQPLLVRAKPTTRERTQLAELTQLTPSPEEEATQEVVEEPTDAATEVATEEPSDVEQDAPEPTAEPEESNIEVPAADQSNIEQPVDETSDLIIVEIPVDAQSYALPFAWIGEATIPAQELAEVAAPLQAQVIQGAFQISYVPLDTGDVIRILPVAAAGSVSSVRIGLSLDANDTVLPFPAGQTLLVQLSARVYAPDASTRLVVADDSGSSRVLLEGLNWNEYQVSRQIAANATTLDVMLEWVNVPANGWLEMTGLMFTLLPTADVVALSPTDTPALIEAVTIAPTAPPPPTPTPTAIATTLPTATPLPDAVAAVAATPSPATPPVAATAAVTVEEVVLVPTPTYIIVTSTPTAVDIFEYATRVALATDWARILGTATPTPPNLATPTPTITPFVVTNTPVPGNAATATRVALYATAVAFTTGTPTPLPLNATVLVATATSIPPTQAPRATSTPTPLYVLLDDIPVNEPAPTPVVPAILYNKIVFLSSYRGNPSRPNAMVMNPDGTEVALLTTNYFYSVIANRDAYSADNRYRVYSLREGGGEAHNAGIVQLFYDDAFYNSTGHQLTYFGWGVQWAPAWSPTSETIAFVSSETNNDEIWVVQRGQYPAIQLTKNDWEWDHHPSFSPDGSQIVFASNRVTGRRQLWIMTSSGDDQRQLTNFTFEAWDPVWVKYVDGQ